MRNKFSFPVLAFMSFIFSSQASYAGSGLLGLDHMVPKSDTGIWSRNNQLALEMGSAIAVVGGSLWEGSDSRLGKTFWKSTDSMLLGAAASSAGKLIFQRERPNQGDGPNSWFKGTDSSSFPSGEVTHITAIVVPFIAEYSEDHPMIWSLAALPIYDAVARVKSQGHWQSDVLAGMALGTAIGLYSHNRPESLLVEVLPEGLSIGIRKRF